MSLREVLETVRKGPTPPNEETAKFQIIAPVLQGLGWNPFSGTEVLYEHPVETAKGGGRVDIALRGDRHSVAHIEMKAPGKDLKRYVKQALGYAFDEGVHICALTTGLEWMLYLPREAGPHNQRLFTTLNVKHDPVDQLAEDLETFLGKENLLSGRSEQRAKEVLEARRQAHHLNTKLPEIWSRMVQGPDGKLVELFIERAYEELNLRPTAEQVKAVLRGSPVPTVTAPEPAAPTSRPQQEDHDPKVPRPTRRSPRRAAKIVAYELWGERHEVKTWKALLVGVSESLYQRHGQSFADRILSLGGTKHPYAARSEHDVRAPKAVGVSGIYIDTNLSSVDIKRRANQLLKLFGHSAEDLRIETRPD
ncbi:hypothetical protein [Candidatus Spongiisocius sp.]|uniref:hypothetical protein n=1 Tax=Candidatus Spongiisocius sp. TaxID=3101273 RepID=UPI003B59D8C7